ncbi:hypothetical protein PIB30_056397 [Stylosanthes scabra]|uniref:Replication factor A C-terminal domain-containing protein n=1 Tax=Stylosanthes scabra TaxID=79078 RepID=A0ABU6WJC6_9FABA|nr:hypothetical protein [Stylosanthes scabra]
MGKKKIGRRVYVEDRIGENNVPTWWQCCYYDTVENKYIVGGYFTDFLGDIIVFMGQEFITNYEGEANIYGLECALQFMLEELNERSENLLLISNRKDVVIWINGKQDTSESSVQAGQRVQGKRTGEELAKKCKDGLTGINAIERDNDRKYLLMGKAPKQRCTVQKIICVTIGTVKNFTSGKFWSYKGCNNCLNTVKEDGDTYKCPNCQRRTETFIPKYALNLKVADEDSYTSFIMYETIGSDYLNISASNLRTKHIMRGGNKNEFYDELGKFKDKTFLFKVSVKLENLNSFQPISNYVPKTTSDNVSEIAESGNWISQPTQLDVEDYNMSATKMRKVARKG